MSLLDATDDLDRLVRLQSELHRLFADVSGVVDDQQRGRRRIRRAWTQRSAWHHQGCLMLGGHDRHAGGHPGPQPPAGVGWRDPHAGGARSGVDVRRNALHAARKQLTWKRRHRDVDRVAGCQRTDLTLLDTHRQLERGWDEGHDRRGGSHQGTRCQQPFRDAAVDRRQDSRLLDGEIGLGDLRIGLVHRCLGDGEILVGIRVLGFVELRLGLRHRLGLLVEVEAGDMAGALSGAGGLPVARRPAGRAVSSSVAGDVASASCWLAWSTAACACCRSSSVGPATIWLSRAWSAFSRSCAAVTWAWACLTCASRVPFWTAARRASAAAALLWAATSWLCACCCWAWSCARWVSTPPEVSAARRALVALTCASAVLNAAWSCACCVGEPPAWSWSSWAWAACSLCVGCLYGGVGRGLGSAARRAIRGDAQAGWCKDRRAGWRRVLLQRRLLCFGLLAQRGRLLDRGLGLGNRGSGGRRGAGQGGLGGRPLGEGRVGCRLRLLDVGRCRAFQRSSSALVAASSELWADCT